MRIRPWRLIFRMLRMAEGSGYFHLGRMNLTGSYFIVNASCCDCAVTMATQVAGPVKFSALAQSQHPTLGQNDIACHTLAPSVDPQRLNYSTDQISFNSIGNFHLIIFFAMKMYSGRMSFRQISPTSSNVHSSSFC